MKIESQVVIVFAIYAAAVAGFVAVANSVLDLGVATWRGWIVRSFVLAGIMTAAHYAMFGLAEYGSFPFYVMIGMTFAAVAGCFQMHLKDDAPIIVVCCIMLLGVWELLLKYLPPIAVSA